MEPAIKRNGACLRLGKHIACDTLGPKTSNVEVEYNLSRSIVNSAKDAVVLEQRHMLGDLTVEPVVQTDGSSAGNLSNDLVEVLPEKPCDDAREAVELFALDLINLNSKARYTFGSRLDIDV